MARWRGSTGNPADVPVTLPLHQEKESDGYLNSATLPVADETKPSAAWEDIGHSNFTSIHEVLDGLPYYFETLRALRRCDEGAYRIFSRIGGQMAAEDSSVHKSIIREPFLTNPPHLRCIFFTQDYSTKSRSTVAALYMMRMGGGQVCVTESGHVALPAEGLNYRIVAVYKMKGKAVPLTCFVNIDADGVVAVVKERRSFRQALPRGGSIPQTAIVQPHWIKQAARDNGRTAQEHIQGLVAIAASAHRPQDAILVRAHQGNMAAAWTIDRRDAKRFFREREGGRTIGGSRKRVLHYVGDFSRTVAGKQQDVRAHYRGEREFDWQGYAVSISGLGFHHNDFFESDMEAFEDKRACNEPMVSLRKTMEVVRRYYDRPRFLAPKRKRAA